MTASDSSAQSSPSSTNARPPRGIGAGARIPNNLLALGSVAVMSIYAVGYLRTKSAADRFDEQFGGEHDSRRRVTAPTDTPQSSDATSIHAHDVNATGLAQRGISDSAALPSGDGRSVRVVTQDAPAIPDGRKGAERTREPGAAITSNAPRPESAPRAVASTNSGASVQGATAASVIAASSDVPTAPVVNASIYSTGNTAAPRVTSSTAASPTPLTPAPDSAKPPAPSAAAVVTEVMPKMTLHDGTYTGYGTSRHGDIEATVIVENGRIKTAAISRCLTRYSCSWIAHLRGQVVARQSPEVDYVSGATESTNAFYYAVLEALTKAQ